MKYILGFSQYGLELDVGKNPTKEDLLNAYLRVMGGPQQAFDHFLKSAIFIEDTIKEANVVKENGTGESV